MIFMDSECAVYVYDILYGREHTVTKDCLFIDWLLRVNIMKKIQAKKTMKLVYYKDATLHLQ